MRTLRRGDRPPLPKRRETS
jgi:hypothetical protein